MTKKTQRRRRLRYAGLATLAVFTVVPAALERAGQEAVAGHLHTERVEIGAGGLVLSPVSATAKGHVLSAETLRVAPRLDGMHITVRGLGIKRAPSSPTAASSSTTDATPTRDQPRAPEPPWAAPLRTLVGIPVHAQVEDTLQLTVAEGLTLEVQRPQLHLPGDGTAETNADVVVFRGTKRLAQAHVDATTDAQSSEIQLMGLASTMGGPTLAVEATLTGSDLATVRLSHPSGGNADLELERQGGQRRVRVDAHDFPLDVLGPELETAWGRVNATQATLAGISELHFDASSIRAHLDDATVSGLRVDSRYLSREEVDFDELSATGDASWTRSSGAVAADLFLTHGDAQMLLSGQKGPESSQLRAELPTVQCQALADSMPKGLLPALAGMQWRGEIAGSLELGFDPAKVRAFASTPKPVERIPGTAELDFDFFERCRVVSDAPGVDLSGLEGPYRHRYVSAGGLDRQRVMAIGDPGFVSANRVPHLTLAFLILEDSRFWRHDGFDREQIERALWHNLGVGRISRGASTISQQTARSLWLGVDRSIGRKIQEAVLTARLESQVPKKRILELYLNMIELGPDVHGVREAALFHFGREPEELNLLEALHLAAHAPAPVTYSRRFASGEVDEQWRAELQNQVGRLRLHGLISESESRTAVRAPLRLRVRNAPHPA